jgi:hypothetical protein
MTVIVYLAVTMDIPYYRLENTHLLSTTSPLVHYFSRVIASA